MAGFEGLTNAQQAVWSQGDFHRIGVGSVVVGELLVRELHVHAGERVLDVAGGPVTPRWRRPGEAPM